MKVILRYDWFADTAPMAVRDKRQFKGQLYRGDGQTAHEMPEEYFEVLPSTAQVEIDGKFVSVKKFREDRAAAGKQVPVAPSAPEVKPAEGPTLATLDPATPGRDADLAALDEAEKTRLANAKALRDQLAREEQGKGKKGK